MAEKASLAKFHAVQRKLATAQKRVEKIREVADEKVAVVIKTAETGGAALLGGVMIGKGLQDSTSMMNNVFGIPTTLGAALALHACGLVGIGGDNAGHLHGIGDGFLAAYLAHFGTQIGAGIKEGVKLTDAVKKAMEGGPGPLTLTQGFVRGSEVAGQRLSEEELASLNK